MAGVRGEARKGPTAETEFKRPAFPLGSPAFPLGSPAFPGVH